MTTARGPAKSDEKEAIGEWFSMIADLVESYPTRTATEAAKIIEYTSASVSPLGRKFNAAAADERAIPDEERATAARHVYRIGRASGWTAEDRRDVKLIDATNGEIGVHGVSPGTGHMIDGIKKLYGACARHRIGITVHAPEPDVIQISLVPQERPKTLLKMTPPVKTLDPGF